ncbi:hypothetical protein V2W45_1249111, partial [Cenococcum geophilum]
KRSLLVNPSKLLAVGEDVTVDRINTILLIPESERDGIEFPVALGISSKL